MNKYALLIIIGSVFLGTSSHAMDSKTSRYKDFLESRLIAQGSDIYNLDSISFIINNNALNQSAQEIVDVSKKLRVNEKTAVNLVTDTLIDGIVYYSSQRMPGTITCDKAFVSRHLRGTLTEMVEKIFRDF